MTVISRRGRGTRGLRFFFSLAAVGLMTACGGGGSSAPPSSSNPPPGNSLVITTSSLPDSIVSISYSTTLQATGAATITWSLASGSLPPGLSLDSAGRISGIADSTLGGGTSIGDYNFTVRASAGGSSATKALSMRNVGQLTMFPGTLISGTRNIPYQSQVQYAAGGPSSYAVSFRIAAGALPPGLALNTSNGLITGTPTEAGNFAFTAEGQDNGNPPQIVRADYSIAIDAALKITTQELTAGREGRSYSHTLASVNGTPPLNWQATGLLNGLNLNSATGEISGTINASQGAWANFTVTDSASPPLTDTRSLFVPVIPRVRITNFLPLAEATLGFTYSTFLNAQYGQLPYTWQIVSGSLPPGLTLRSDGAIDGTPTQLGAFPFRARVEDSLQPPDSDEEDFTIPVVSSNLSVLNTPAPSGAVSVPYRDVLRAQGGDLPYQWRIKSGMLPEGLSLDGATGEITGTPVSPTAGTFEVEVQDSGPVVQTDSAGRVIRVTLEAVDRNDSPATATPISNGRVRASISPWYDFQSRLWADQDFYKIVASPGAHVVIEVFAQRLSPASPLDSVLRLLSADGFSSPNCVGSCINDDIQPGLLDSRIVIDMPAGPGIEAETLYIQVLDWRGQARPEFIYELQVSGAQ